MNLALAQAKLAMQKEEVPVGAILVDQQGRVRARGHNCVISKSDPTAHAEISCIRQACNILQNYRLQGMTLYSTLEPCHMCLGSILHSRIDHLVYATQEPKFGAIESSDSFLDRMHGYRELEGLTSGICANAAGALMVSFFQVKR